MRSRVRAKRSVLGVIDPERTARVGPRIQRSLAVGRSDDPIEREADRTAAMVMRRLEEGVGQDVGPSSGGAPRVVRRSAADPAEYVIGPEGGEVDAATSAAISSSRGRALEPATRTSMEDAFGADFSSVRVHTGPRADALSARLSAKAFTSGSDIFIRSGDYAPNAPGGQRTLAHELAHVVQQGAAGAPIRRENGTATKTKRKEEEDEEQLAATTLNIGAPVMPGQNVLVAQKPAAPTRKPPPKPLPKPPAVKGQAPKPLPKPPAPKGQAPIKPLPAAKPKAPTRQAPKAPKPLPKPPDKGQPQTQPTQVVQQDTPVVTRPRAVATSTKPTGGGWSAEPEEQGPSIGGAHKRTAETFGVVTSSIGAQDTALLTQTKQSTTDDDAAANQQRATLQVAAPPFALSASLITLGESIRKLFKADKGWDRFKAGMDVTGAALQASTQIANVVDKSAQQQQGYGQGLGTSVGQAAKSQSTVGAISMSIITDVFNNVKDNIQRIKDIIDAVKESKKHGLTKKEKWDEVIKSSEAVAKTASTAAGTAKSIMTMTSGATDAVMQAVPGLSIAVNALSVIKRAVEFVREARSFYLIREQKRGLKKGGGWVKNKALSQQGQVAARRTEIENMLQTGKYDPADKPDLEEELEATKQYQTAKALQTINEKRMKRQGVLISTDVANILGDALVLSGAAAAAGGGVKAASSAVKTTLPIIRKTKQAGRNKAAEQLAQGKTGTVLQKVFDASKSSKAKNAAYEAQVNQMLSMLSNLTFNPIAQQAEMVKVFYQSAGMSWSVLNRYDDANELGKDLYKLLQKRE